MMKTVLRVVAYYKFLDMVMLLLKNGADVNVARSLPSGKTSLQGAVYRVNLPLV